MTNSIGLSIVLTALTLGAALQLIFYRRKHGGIQPLSAVAVVLSGIALSLVFAALL